MLVESGVKMSRKGCAMLAVVVVAIAATRLGAQVTETPVAFDSAGRVRTLTPALVARLD